MNEATLKIESLLTTADQKELTNTQLDILFSLLKKTPSNLQCNFCTKILKSKSQFVFLRKLRDDDKKYDRNSLLTMVTITLGYPYEKTKKLEDRLKHQKKIKK